MNFIRGKLCKCPGHFLLIYPTKEKTTSAWWASPSSSYGAAAAHASTAASAVTDWAAYWSYRLKCQVHCIAPGEIFMVLEKDGPYVHVLFGEKQGWIINNGLQIEALES